MWIDIIQGTDSRQELTTKIVSPRSPVYQEVIGGASLSLIILELATQSPLRSRCVRKPVEPNYTCASSRGKAAVTCHVSRDPCHNVTRENCGAESPCYSVTMSRRCVTTRLQLVISLQFITKKYFMFRKKIVCIINQEVIYYPQCTQKYFIYYLNGTHRQQSWASDARFPCSLCHYLCLCEVKMSPDKLLYNLSFVIFTICNS